MEERQVTAEGETRPLPDPFFVVATQNPSYQLGTFPLPESQLDRFLMRISLGYPPLDAERQLLLERERRDLLDEITPVLTPQQLLALQQQVREVRAAPALIDYIRSEEHTSELQSLMRISYAVFCLKKTKQHPLQTNTKS